jgi:hypothetical protein
MRRSLALTAVTISGNLGVVYVAGPIGWAVAHFVCLLAVLLILLARDNRRTT